MNLSFLQNFGIFLVVLGHSLPTEGITSPVAWFRSVIYSFHMPLFMAISGFLFIYSSGTKGDYLNFVKNKFFRLLIPYFTISTIAFFPKVILSRYAYRPIELSVNSFVNNLIYPSENAIIFFWFLPTLFVIFLISPLIERGIKTKWKQLIISLAFVVLNTFSATSTFKIFNISGVMEYLVYFWCGCLLAYYWTSIKSILNMRVIFAILFLALIVLNSIKIDNTLFALITAITGVLMSFSLSLTQLNFYLFKGIDGYSYQIYLLSWFPQTFVTILFLGRIPYILIFVSMFITGLWLPVIVSKIINKYTPKLNIILGMKSK
ncbi:hypothetical protein BAU15_14125 [Enterococcus sp. JM4C]|uniref:acyltransferase family protein n=1 Tax=Candidatus Enterococcus huntleyi TaxID=1857217 RepID=UPI00137B147E|nr:acyltransferase [Enterococcus sp. JM4C]KAF1298816.1 hypothetical protein BAU15_14125 [Enterococcus sp. JM4C]